MNIRFDEGCEFKEKGCEYINSLIIWEMLNVPVASGLLYRQFVLANQNTTWES